MLVTTTLDELLMAARAELEDMCVQVPILLLRKMSASPDAVAAFIRENRTFSDDPIGTLADSLVGFFGNDTVRRLCDFSLDPLTKAVERFHLATEPDARTFEANTIYQRFTQRWAYARLPVLDSVMREADRVAGVYLEQLGDDALNPASEMTRAYDLYGGSLMAAAVLHGIGCRGLEHKFIHQSAILGELCAEAIMMFKRIRQAARP